MARVAEGVVDGPVIPSWTVGIGAIAVGVAAVGVFAWLFGKGGKPEATEDAPASRHVPGCRRGAAAGALLLVLVARDSISSRRGRPAGAIGSCSSSRTTTGARGRSRSTSRRRSGLRRRRRAASLALAVRAIRRHAVAGDVRVRPRLGRLGPRRLHAEDGAALGPARGHRGLLREPRVARRESSSPTR